MKTFVQSYFDRAKQLIDEIKVDQVVEVITQLEMCHERAGRIYIIGNGGSAATASHMANDLAVGLKLRGIRQFEAISLADNVSVCSAIANDTGYENIFSVQLDGVLKKEDLIIAISCSGNSPNITKAVDYAKQTETHVIGLTGFDGGYLKRHCDTNLHIQSDKGEYGVVEDLHMMIDHVIFSYYQHLHANQNLAKAM